MRQVFECGRKFIKDCAAEYLYSCEHVFISENYDIKSLDHYFGTNFTVKLKYKKI